MRYNEIFLSRLNAYLGGGGGRGVERIIRTMTARMFPLTRTFPICESLLKVKHKGKGAVS